jgi:hypothetical protein
VRKPPLALAGSEPRGIEAVAQRADAAVLVARWQYLRRGTTLPSLADFDPASVSASWPEAVLLGYDPDKRDIGRATRLCGADSKTVAYTIEYTPMVTEWLLELGRKALRCGVPQSETRSFEVSRGLVAYRAVALPLSAERGGADQVICHLGRA